MPELPEVETVVRDLRPQLVGATIRKVVTGERLRTPWQTSWNRPLVGSTIEALSRRGKWIIVDLQGAALVGHLGMTGQLTVHDRKETVRDHVHLRFALGEDRELRFRDVRRFGGWEYFVTTEKAEQFLNDRLGPEPFDLQVGRFHERLSLRRPVKSSLLDQKVVAGVGNIYADEALHVASLHPERTDMTPIEAERLRAAIVSILTDAITRRGSTIRDYIGGSGLQGGYQQELKVYGRKGEPCFHCQTLIEVRKLGGRSSHFCPACQR